MNRTRLAGVGMAICLLPVARADGTKTWSNVGDVGGPVLWAAGLTSSLLQDGRRGAAHTARTLDGFMVDGVLTEGLKALTRERRPYSSSHDSFPSLHTSLSFEVAAAQSYFHPRQAPIWYAAASLISYSRVPAHEHHWQDVLSGAALGYGCGQLSVSSHRGWLITPMIEKGHPGLSILLAKSF